MSSYRSLNILAVVFIAVFFLILFFVGLGIRQILTAHNIMDAEQEATAISKMLLKTKRDLLLVSDSKGGETLNVVPENFQSLDEYMRSHMGPYNIVKIKIFSKDEEIVYSTDTAIIGKIDSHNEKLKRALKGEVVSKLEKKEVVWDLEDEQRFDVDIVETYLPVRDKKNEVIGSFEIYIDTTQHRSEIAAVLMSSIIVIAIILVLAFGFLIALLRRMRT